MDKNVADGQLIICRLFVTMQKDKSVYGAYLSALEDARKHGNLPVPLNLRSADQTDERFGLRRRICCRRN